MSRRVTAAQPDLSRIRNYQFTATLIKRALIFLIAFTGLIGAACVNGIPSITCYAMADAYTISLANLGSLFLIELLVIGIIVVVERNFKDVDINTINKRGFLLELRVSLTVPLIFFGFVFCIVMLTTIHGVKNIQVAIAHCLQDAPQKTHNSNDRIPLLRNLFSDEST
jgi:predicted transporter